MLALIILLYTTTGMVTVRMKRNGYKTNIGHATKWYVKNQTLADIPLTITRERNPPKTTDAATVPTA